MAEGRYDKGDFAYDAPARCELLPWWRVGRSALPERREGHEHLQVLGLGVPAFCTAVEVYDSDYLRSGDGSTRPFSTRCRLRSIGIPRSCSFHGQTAEHPFGTIKAWMGVTHFLSRRFPRVREERDLPVLA